MVLLFSNNITQHVYLAKTPGLCQEDDNVIFLAETARIKKITSTTTGIILKPTEC
jgi:hypothetical protein